MISTSQSTKIFVLCVMSDNLKSLKSQNSCIYILYPFRKMVKKSLVAGLVVLLVAAVGFFMGVYLGIGNKRLTVSSDHFYSKAAVAADAGKCSEVGR